MKCKNKKSQNLILPDTVLSDCVQLDILSAETYFFPD